MSGDEFEDITFEKTDLERVGQFREGPFDHEVILYRPDIMTVMGRDPTEKDDPLRLDPVHWGYPILPGHKLKAATNDWVFSPFLYLWEDEPYEDPGAWRRLEKIENMEKMLDGPWLVSGPKTMNGLGTYYGTFIDEMEAFSPEADEDVDDRLRGVANFLTNPGKKGSYGYNDICINPFTEWEEDPLYDLTEARREMREEFEEAMVDGIWYPTAHPGGFFDPNPFIDPDDPEGTIETYDWDRLLPPENLDIGPGWIPNSFTKCINGNKDVVEPLERFPEYEPSDEYNPPPPNVFRNFDPDLNLAGPWFPQFGNRKRHQRSTVQYCINLQVNNMTFHRQFI